MVIIAYLNGQSRARLIVLTFALVVVVGALDYATGSEIAFSILYLAPVSLAAWFLGRRLGRLAALAAGVAWLLADRLGGASYSHPAIPYWNATVGLGVFLVVAHIVAALRSAREAQEQLAQFVVHDLRSPLTNVMTALATLQDLHGEQADPMERELCQIAVNSSQRLLLLTNSLLDLSRLENGKMPLAWSSEDARALLDAAAQQIVLWAGQNGVTLKLEVAPGTPPVHVDRELTERVLANLLGNAVKFSPQGSTITARVRAQADGEVLFSVKDQGPGIPKEWTRRVFDKFAQVEARKAGAAVGTGLGLTFCRLAVQAQGGRIWLESDTGAGTEVFFTLPPAR